MTTQSGSDAALAEAEFFRRRALYGDSTWVGLSSDAMLRQAITGAEHPDNLPMDKWDLDRCEETYRRAPEHLKAKMLPTLEIFRRVVKQSGLWCWACDHGGQSSTWRGLCKPHAEEAGIDTRPIWEREGWVWNGQRYVMPEEAV